MTLDEAVAFLSGCVRDELRDYAFGDSEVSWLDDRGVVVADGYFGRLSRVSLVGKNVVFGDADARKLRDVGRRGGVERNDGMVG